MSAVIQLPAGQDRYDIETVRRAAKRLGLNPSKTVAEFVRIGCPRGYLNTLSERARRARMERDNGGAA